MKQRIVFTKYASIKLGTNRKAVEGTKGFPQKSFLNAWSPVELSDED